jgi:hypothetical protein
MGALYVRFRMGITRQLKLLVEKRRHRLRILRNCTPQLIAVRFTHRIFVPQRTPAVPVQDFA